MRGRSSTFRLGDEINAAMARLQVRDGISPSEQVRRALVPWLEKKGVLTKAERQRPASRKRS